MHIIFNGDRIEAPEDLTLAALIHKYQINQDASAAAVNGEIITKTQWTEYVLKPDDAVDVFTMVSGGACLK